MGDRETGDDWGALAYRVRLLEDRASEDRRATNAAIELMRREHDSELKAMRDMLREDYLTRDQIAVSYASRTEARQAAAARREWPVALAALAAAACSVATFIMQVGGH